MRNGKSKQASPTISNRPITPLCVLPARGTMDKPKSIVNTWCIEPFCGRSGFYIQTPYTYEAKTPNMAVVAVVAVVAAAAVVVIT